VPRDEIAIGGPEQPREAVAAELVGLGERQQLDEEAGQLDDAVVRAPVVPVARADDETEPLVQRPARVEVAHRVNDMVEAARHPSSIRGSSPDSKSGAALIVSADLKASAASRTQQPCRRAGRTLLRAANGLAHIPPQSRTPR